MKLRSKSEGIQVLPDGILVVKINVPPEDGKANERIRDLIAVHLGLAKSAVVLVSGFKGRAKVFEVSLLNKEKS